MSPVDVSVLLRKLALIEERLDRLRPLASLGSKAYQDDWMRKKGAEKALQELVNAAIDANFHVLVESGRPIPKDAHDSFADLVAAGVLTDADAKALAPFAGLRNRLVHEYETIDDDRVLKALQSAQMIFPAYIKSIRDRYCPPR